METHIMTPLEAARLVFNNVQGWVGDRIYHIIEFIEHDHYIHEVEGDIAEIGVHHGMLFFLMLSLLRKGEAGIAIDLFSEQHLNVDKSGSGSRAIFDEHLKTHFAEYESRVRVIEGDSLALRSSDIQARMANRSVRLFSVDGGHNVEHVVNDMSLAQDVIAPRGVVMLDDFLGPHWPSVTEGFFRFMDVANRRLAPFLVFQNKLFLTTYSEHDSVLKDFHAFIAAKVGDEIHSRWTYGKICGFQVLCFA